MQINAAALLASQQMTQPQAKSAPGFAAALEKTAGFEPLPLKQMRHTDKSPAAATTQTGPMRLGSTVDMRV